MQKAADRVGIKYRGGLADKIGIDHDDQSADKSEVADKMENDIIPFAEKQGE